MRQPDEAVSELIHEQITEEQQESILQNQQRKLEQDKREFERVLSQEKDGRKTSCRGGPAVSDEMEDTGE